MYVALPEEDAADEDAAPTLEAVALGFTAKKVQLRFKDIRKHKNVLLHSDPKLHAVLCDCKNIQAGILKKA